MEELYLGVAREIITPPVGGPLYGYYPDVYSNAVEDELQATAFYFRQGKTIALMVSATVCLVQTELADHILSTIAQKHMIPKESCMLCATHTHSGPNVAGEYGWGSIDTEYCENIFVPQILKAVERAVANTEPVRVGVAAGNSYVGINRRELKANNTVELGQNEWGCFNPRMTVISFRNAAGKTVANMIHYGAHGTAAGINHEITRDWPGIMTDMLEEVTGGITAFFNGPEGDIGPRLSNGATIGNLWYMKELGFVAAHDAVQIYRTIKTYKNVSLRAMGMPVKLPLKKRMAQADAQKQYERFKDKTVSLEASIRKHCEDVLASYAEDYQEQEDLVFKQSIITIGDLAFVSFPYEVFSEIGMRIDREIKGCSVLSLSNTNGSEGYFVTQDQLCRGGYEIAMFRYGKVQPYCDDADWHLVRGTVENLNQAIDT